MNDREKLIELVAEARSKEFKNCCSHAICEGCAYKGSEKCHDAFITDHLIANGVTAQQWIPVTERLPEKDGSYLTLNKQNSVLQLTFFKEFGESCNRDLSGKKNIWCDYDSEYGYYKCLDITHWMPLPIPLPPRGE